MASLTVGMGSKTGTERVGVPPWRPALLAGPGAGGVRSAVVTSQSHGDRPVMACWQRNWQVTQPPAAARRRRTDMKTATASAAEMAAPAMATVTATVSAAVSKKRPAGRANTSHATATMAASQTAGRA